ECADRVPEGERDAVVLVDADAADDAEVIGPGRGQGDGELAVGRQRARGAGEQLARVDDEVRIRVPDHLRQQAGVRRAEGHGEHARAGDGERVEVVPVDAADELAGAERREKAQPAQARGRGERVARVVFVRGGG